MPVVIPELVLIVGLFFAIVGYMTARGLLSSWTHSIGYLLEALAAALVFAIPLGFGRKKKIDLGGPVRALDKVVVTALQNWCAGAEIEMGYCLHGLEKVSRYMAQAIDYGFRETAQTFDWLVDIHLPKWAKYALAPILWPLLLPKLLTAILPHVGAHVLKTVKVVEHDIRRVVVHTTTRVVGGAVAFPPWVIRLPHRLRGVEGDLTKLKRRLHKLEGIAAAGVFAGLLANVLGVTTKCVRSGNVGKAARRLCGLDNLVMDALLADLAFVAGTISIVEFAKALQKAAPLVATSLVYVVDEIPIAVDDAEAMGKRALKILDSVA